MFCFAPLRFFTTASTLLPNTTYTVIVRRPGATYVPAPRSFTTGEQNTAAVDPAPVELRSYRLSLGTCYGTVSPCGDYVELELGKTALETQQPFWLRLTASRHGTETSTVLGSGSASRAILPADAEQPCIDYERFDARGQRVESRQLCQRDKCAVGHPDCIFSGRPGDGCVGPAALGPDAWELVGADSCDATPRLSRGCLITMSSSSSRTQTAEREGAALRRPERTRRSPAKTRATRNRARTRAAPQNGQMTLLVVRSELLGSAQPAWASLRARLHAAAIDRRPARALSVANALASIRAALADRSQPTADSLSAESSTADVRRPQRQRPRVPSPTARRISSRVIGPFMNDIA